MSDYWRERAEADMDAVQDAADVRIRRIGRAHLQAVRDLTAQVEKIIGTYAKRMHLTREEAEKALRAPFDEDSRAYGYRMTRAEALRQAAREQAEKLADLERREVKAQREYTARESSRRAGELLGRMGVGIGFASPDTGGLTRSLNTRWTGKSYSDSIWANTSALADMLEKEVTAAFLSGKSNAAISQIITQRFGVEFRQAERLVRTETSYVCNRAAVEAYRDAGLDTFEFLTARDSRTCPICAKRNGDVVALDEGEPGKNMPPMHPWCRCTVLPVVEGWEDASEHIDDKTSKIAYNIDGHSMPVNAKDAATGRYAMAEVAVNVDELSPCLRRIGTNELVPTSFELISPSKDETMDWEFDWTRPERFGYQVFALKAEGDDRIQGLIAMKPDPGNYAVQIDVVEAAPHNSVHNPKNKKHTKEYAGVGGHLFAEAARQSRDYGFDGFVFFQAKNNLIPYYQELLGAKLINQRDRIMAIDEAAAEKLIKRYYGGE